MGRWYWNSKTTVEQATQLNIFKLKEFGLLDGFYHATTLTWTHTGSGHKDSIGIAVDIVGTEPYVKVNYTTTDRNTDEKTDYDYKIGITTTPCYFGGVRYWFVCPLSKDGVSCGNRVGTLYLASGGNYFGCRHCYDLSYASRNESRLGRFGEIGYFLVAERQMEERYMNLKRRYYAGKPTRKYRQILKIQNRLDSINIPTMEEVLYYGKKKT